MFSRLIARLVREIATLAVHAYFVARYYLVERRQQSHSRCYSGERRSETGLWCIFAVWQSEPISPNLIAAFERLNDAGYNIVLINNGPLPGAAASALLHYCHTFFTKPHGGRDFGSYQFATAWLHRTVPAAEIRQVLYCNDSVFIRPSRFAALLARLRDRDSLYIGVTGSSERFYHVSSWFFAVSGVVFDHPGFHEFWRRYTPFSSRTYVIRRGEIGLSQALSKLHIDPEILFTAEAAVDECFKTETPRVIQAVARLSSIWLWDQQLRPYFSNLEYAEPTASGKGELPLLSKEFLRRRLIDYSDSENNMNFYNLFYAEYCDLPFLKKDLVYRGQYLIAQIEEVVGRWEGCDRQHVPEVLGYFRSRSAIRWIHGLRGYLTRHGIL
jgi:hypothetical protein